MSGSLLPAPRTLLVAALVLAAAVTPGHARLGETLDKIKERFGRPEPQIRKDAFVWTFEASEGGLLIYTVTFDAKGQSVAEGLKPRKLAILSAATAQGFINMQLEPYKGSPTARIIKPGEKYGYGGKAFVCGEHEYVIVDEANRFLLVWSQDGIANVVIVRPDMV